MKYQILIQNKHLYDYKNLAIFRFQVENTPFIEIIKPLNSSWIWFQIYLNVLHCV